MVRCCLAQGCSAATDTSFCCLAAACDWLAVLKVPVLSSQHQACSQAQALSLPSKT